MHPRGVDRDHSWPKRLLIRLIRGGGGFESCPLRFTYRCQSYNNLLARRRPHASDISMGSVHVSRSSFRDPAGSAQSQSAEPCSLLPPPTTPPSRARPAREASVTRLSSRDSARARVQLRRCLRREEDLEAAASRGRRGRQLHGATTDERRRPVGRSTRPPVQADHDQRRKPAPSE